MKNLNIKFIYEGNSNLKNNLFSLFGNEAENIFNLFLKKGICKPYKYSDFSVEYVGIIVYKEIVIIVLPKILKKYKLSQEEEIVNSKHIAEVIKKYNKETISSAGEENIDYGNIYSLIDYFFKDYIKNGLYEIPIEKDIFNGEGEVNWEKTVENEIAYYNSENLVYIDLWNEEIETNSGNYIRNLHKYILNECKLYLENSEIQEILQLIKVPNFELYTDEKIGSMEENLVEIDKRLRREFNESKIILLKNMKHFLNKIYGTSEIGLEIWGVNKFWEVWEKVTKTVLGNQKELQDYMLKPKWCFIGDESKIKKLVPDILRDCGNIFYIFDAKYYDIYLGGDNLLNGKLIGVPDIAKQHIYELEIKQKLKKEVKNYFVIPGKETKIIGSTKLMIEYVNKIELLSLDYKEAFDKYLNNEKYSAEELQELLNIN